MIEPHHDFVSVDLHTVDEVPHIEPVFAIGGVGEKRSDRVADHGLNHRRGDALVNAGFVKPAPLSHV